MEKSSCGLKLESSNEDLLFERREPETRDLIGRMPTWIMRVGGPTIVFFILGLIVSSYLIHYPEKVLASITVVYTRQPQILKAPKNGRIAELFVQDNAMVVPFEPIAMLENQANLYQVEKLDSIARQIYNARDLKTALSKYDFDQNIQIGDLQSQYRDLQISIKNYHRLIDASIVLDIEYQQKILDNIKLLRDQILHWKEANIIFSTINGRISYLKSLREDYMAINDEEIIAVMPTGKTRHNAIGKIDISSRYKIKSGQIVLINLDAFPSTQYGYIKGRITKISNANVDNKCLIEISLPDHLRTTDNQDIPLQSNLVGSGEILITNQSILSRILNKLRKESHQGG